MRSSNPVISRIANVARDVVAPSSSGTMTISGTAAKAMVLLLVTVGSALFTWIPVSNGNLAMITPALLVGGLGGFIVALMTGFRPMWAPVTAPIYAALEGLFLGAMSALYATRFAGLPMQAVLLTFAVAGTVLVLYRIGVLRATEGFKRIIFGATAGIAVFYLVSLVLSLFKVNIGYFGSTSPLSIGINLVIAAIAALNLVLDFDQIEEAARRGAPKQLEWYSAFGLVVTLVWLYLELLRLLSRLNSSRD
jgi:uncharacterized YccA/Bax inhibitor family protein